MGFAFYVLLNHYTCGNPAPVSYNPARHHRRENPHLAIAAVPVYVLEHSLSTIETMLPGLGSDGRISANSAIVMKVDIEVNEYPTLLSAKPKVLGRFDQIVVETHYGDRNIARHLERCGFDVSHLNRTIDSYNPKAVPHLMLVSLLNAEKGEGNLVPK